MDSLPCELVLAIFAHLDELALARLSATSPKLRDLALDEATLEKRFRAQPWSYAVIAVGKDLLFRPGVARVEVLRFILDARRARETLAHAYKTTGTMFDGTVDVFEYARRYHLWAACTTDNPYLAQAYYFGYGLHFYERMEDAYIYFDLLFRHGMWEEAKRSIPCRLPSRDWLVERVPAEVRGDLFEGNAKPRWADSEGFRSVRGYKTLSTETSQGLLSNIELALCPFVTLQQLRHGVQLTLRELHIAHVMRGLPPTKEMEGIKLQSHPAPLIVRRMEFTMSFMREGRLGC